MNEDYLCHHGVKGMKWGIRKARKKTSIFPRKKKASKQQTQNNQKKEKKVNIKKLSDKELQSKIQRLQLERQYRNLKREELSEGRKLVGEILKASGRTLGIQVANYVGGKAINKAFKDEVVSVGKKKNKEKNKAA